MTADYYLSVNDTLKRIADALEIIAGKKKETEENAEKKRIEEKNRIDLLSLYDVNLLTKTRYALLRSGFKTVGQIRSLSKRQLLGLRGIGQQGIADIEAMLFEYGMELPKADFGGVK